MYRRAFSYATGLVVSLAFLYSLGSCAHAAGFFRDDGAKAVSTNAPLAEVAAQAKHDTKPCPVCAGTGAQRCRARGCKKGQRDCPGPCLKLSVGKWEEVPGYGLSIFFRDKNGKAIGGHGYNYKHVGEVVEVKGGQLINKGKCDICGGTGKVACKICGGDGELPCSACDGAKEVPLSWQPPAPKEDDQASQFSLKDGRVIKGRIIIDGSADVVIKTSDGSRVTIPKDQILPAEPSPFP